MDERHWWIAAKVEKTFCIEKANSTDASFIEAYFRRPEILDRINNFLFAKGSNKLFFYTTRDRLHLRDIICCHSIADEYGIVNEPLDNIILLYFIRSDTSSDASISPSSDIYCGEIKHAPQMVPLLYSQTLLPLFKRELAPSNHDTQQQIATKANILAQMERQIDTLSTTCHILQKDKNLLLKRVDSELINQLKQSARATADSPVIRSCETLVLSWISTIENVLQDIFGEDSVHPSLGPLSEIDRWTRKQRLINTLLEQLKSKECKAVIGALITSKSKVIRKWKTIDISITEAQNECRDKMKFLESIRRFLENLTEDAHPQNCAVNILPALCDAMRTVESVSRYYARQGYLGLIFSKVTNQLVKICKYHVGDDLSQLWPKLFNEIQMGGRVDDIKENFHLDKRDLKRFREISKASVPLESHSNNESSFQRLKNCLLLLASYKEIFRTLRDALGGAQLLASTAFSTASSSTMSATTNAQASDQSPSRHQARHFHGILMSEDEKIFFNYEEFGHRIEQMLDMTVTLNQFSQLISSTVRLPKPKRNDLIEAENVVHRSELTKRQQDDQDEQEQEEKDEQKQEQQEENPDSNSDEGIDDTGSDSGAAYNDYLVSSVSKADLELIKKYYSNDDESLLISVFIVEGVERLKSILSINNSSNDDEKIKFNSLHQKFTTVTREMEQFIGAYVNVMFSKTKRTHEGLAILASFEPICERQHLRSTLRDAYVNLFLNFENDLIEVRTTFEAHKNHPPLPRNAPPVPGAIAWSRTLLNKIEKAMDVFKVNRHIISLGNFPILSKLYNRTAKELLVYEQFLLSRWKEKIEAWKDHLNANLLCLIKNSPEEPIMAIPKVAINSNIELFSIFDEVKWLRRLDVDIPKAAINCIQKEKTFKHYKSLLEDLLTRFNDLQSRIHRPFFPLFLNHATQVYRAFEPGLHTLTWSSLNIDGYISKVHRALDNFETSISNVNILIAQKINQILDEELMSSNCLLFSIDYIRSKSWLPSDFLNEMRLHLNERSIEIGKRLSSIQDTFREVEEMLKSSPNEQKSRTSTSSTRRAKTMTASVPNEAMKKFIQYYYEKMNRSIEKIIERTLHVYVDLVATTETKYLIDETKLIRYLFEGQNNNEFESNIDHQRIRLTCTMLYAIPEIIIEPQMSFSQKCILDVAQAIIESRTQIGEAAGFDRETIHSLSSMIESNLQISTFVNRLSTIETHVVRISQNAFQYIRTFDFLWRDDSQLKHQIITEIDENNQEYTVVIDPEGIPSPQARLYLQNQLDKLIDIEKRLQILPTEIQIGCIWKTQYAKVLHKFARTQLEEVVQYRQQVQSRFKDDVSTLEQLDEALTLLEELGETENKIDGIYLPIETTYQLLDQVYNIPVPRDELYECSQLRSKWSELISNADRVRKQLLQERRQQLEQELDKQVKSFVVEVIRFRNAFDVEGPNIPGLSPLDAAKRLKDFQGRYHIMHRRKQTLNSISTLFSLQTKQFPELDKTGEELVLLDQLYILYKKFIAFDTTFRASLWSDVDLNMSRTELNQLWSEFCNLPSKLKERIWTAYYDLEGHLEKYRRLLPLLFMLNAREIRSRHWLKVMQITGCSFQLESSIFKLNDLLDISLDAHQEEISAICFSAQKELELETKMRSIEEEWTEQILNFEPYKDYGHVLLEKRYVEHLLEHLEDGEETLAQMLTTRYIEPMRESVASWAEKLQSISEVLELWLEVQDLWLGAENIFNNPSAGKDISLESKRFVRVDKTWIRSQKQSSEIRNVLQCCLSEPPKKGILKEMQKELEICNKSISLYLDRKRQVFPRFYFLTNRTLISVLSRQDTISCIQPHFRSIFSGIRGVKLVVTHSDPSRQLDERRGTISAETRAQSETASSPHQEINQVMSDDGDCMELHRPVPLHKTVEQWVARLQESVAETLRTDIYSCVRDLDNGLPYEELVSKYTCQVSLVGLLYAWTREVENGIIECKTDRKGLNVASKRFSVLIQKIPSALTRSQWRTPAQPVLYIHKLRLEGVLAFAAYLRDAFDSLSARRREISLKDFDWRRCFRLYSQHVSQTSEGKSSAESSVISMSLSPEPIRMQVLDDVFPYGYEFHGIRQTLSITPTTEKCFLAIWSSISFKRPALVQGNAAVGKKFTIMSLARFLGRFLATFECSQHVDASAATMFITGLASDGCWGVFHDIHSLMMQTLSPLTEYITLICDALRTNTSSATILSESKEVPIRSSVGILATRNPFSLNLNNDSRTALLPEIRSRFRIVSIVKPDLDQIIRIKCFEYNFKNANVIAEKITLLHEITRLYFPSNYRTILSIGSFVELLEYVNNMRKGSNSRPNSMTSAGTRIDDFKRSLVVKTPSYTGVKSDQLFVAQAFLDVVLARLPPEHAKIFRTFVLHIFVGKDEPKLNSFASTSAILEKIISDKVPDHDLIPKKNWITKCVQMIHAANVSKQMILCGAPHSGKSTAAMIMIDILTQMQQQHQLQSSNQQKNNGQGSESNYIQESSSQIHKLYRINPLAMESENLFLGYNSLANEWLDGILTLMLRKANRNCHTSWICFDGTISRSWADLLPSILQKESSLQIRNGDKLFLLDQVKFIFETSSLSEASPTFIANSNIIYFDKCTLDWKMIADAWLKNRRPLELNCLQKCFDKVMEPLMNFLRDKCSRTIHYSETSLFSMSLRLLDAILRDSTHVTTDVHVERFFIFCFTFVLKAILNSEEQQEYSDLLKGLVSVLPDDDRKISVFEYYVDESCEWDLWTAKVEELNENIQDHFDPYGNILVQTVDLARAHYFLKFASLAKVNVLLSGATGSSKSFLLDTFTNGLDQTSFMAARLNFSKATNAVELQKFIESNIVHRQGFTFGAPLGKKFCLFIDDIQASANCGLDKFRNAPEFLRSIVDHHQYVTQQKPYEKRIIDDFFVLATATLPSNGDQSLITVNPRLLRHFIFINIPTPSETSLRQILSSVIEVNMLNYGKMPLNSELTVKIVDALTETLQRIQRALQPSHVTGREHYLFSVRHIITAIQSLRLVDGQTRNQAAFLAPFLKHELYRIIYDQLVREIDQNWFKDTLNDIFQTKFQWDKNEDDHLYFTFPLEGRSYERPLNSLIIKELKTQIQPVESLSKLRKSIDQVAMRYREEFGHHTFSLAVSENTALHIIRLHRIFSHSSVSNLLMIGCVGSHLSKLVRLAFYLAEIQEQTIDHSTKSSFFDSLRAVVRTTGVEGRHIGILLTNKHLRESDLIDTISSLLTSCECPHLFSKDEVDGLYQAVINSFRRDQHISVPMIADPRRYFLSRIRHNLHIAICLPAHCDLLSNLATEYPGILKHTQVYWIKNWGPSTLNAEASFFLSSRDMPLPEDLRQRLSSCLSTIHFFMLNECRQLPFVGNTDRTILLRENQSNNAHSMNNSKEHMIIRKNNTKDNKESKMVEIELPNYPYSRTLLYEQIKSHGQGKSLGVSSLHAFVGPESFLRFMQAFWYLFTSKAAICERDIIRLNKVLSTLNKTRQDAEQMKEYIETLKQKCADSEKETALLLEEVIYKSMVLEKLRAKYGLAGSLPGYNHRDESDDYALPEEEKKWLMDDEADEYEENFKRMKEESVRSRQAKMQEEYEEALREVEKRNHDLSTKRKDVEFWMAKVNKSCIESIRALQTPPILIGQIMEMILTLIGRKPATKLEIRESEQEKGTGKAQTQRLDRNQWKQYTSLMSDSGRFVDILHGVSWQDGLSLDVANAVESYIAKGRDGISDGISGEGSLLDNPKTFHVPAAKVTSSHDNRITLSTARYACEEAATLVHYVIALVEYTKLCQPLHLAKQRVARLKNDISDAEQKQLEKETEIQRLKKMEASLHTDVNETDHRMVDVSKYTTDDLPNLQAELAEAQNRFDAAAVKKSKLRKEYESCQTRLQAAVNVTQSIAEMELFDKKQFKHLSDLEDQWTKWITEHSTHEQTLTNCILAAAYMTYCSPFDADLRRNLCQKFIHFCEQYDIPREADLVFQPIPIDSLPKNLMEMSSNANSLSYDSTMSSGKIARATVQPITTLAEFLYNNIELKEFQLLGLLPTDILTENGCMIMADAGLNAWPLICDSTWYSIDWIRMFLNNKKLIIVRYHQLRTQLETALSEGLHLLLTDCDPSALMANDKLETVIRNQARFASSEKPFKLQIGQQEIECSPKFRLYLHTIASPVLIPKELAAYTLTVQFHLTLTDLEEIFLTRFMMKEKRNIFIEQNTLLQEKVDTLKIIDPLKQNITNFLAADTLNLLHSVEPTKRLSDLKKAYDEAIEGSQRVAMQEENLFKTRNSYQKLAQRAATCYNMMHYLRELFPDYVMPLEHFIEVFDSCIFQSEKHSMGSVMTDLTRAAFITIYRMLNDRDRRVFTIYFAMEIEAFNRRQNHQFDLNHPTGEREFIISPSWAVALLQKRGARVPSEHRFWSYKKPFDWMTDEAYQNLQYLAIFFDWFSDGFERMAKEGQEAKWRPLCEGDTENYPLPSPLEQLEPIQKFCIVRAIRSDRLLQASTVYVTNVFLQDSSKTRSLVQDHHHHPNMNSSQGSNTARTTSIPVTPTLQQDAELLTRQSAQRAVILFYEDEPDEVINFFLYCTSFIQAEPNNTTATYQVVHIYGNGPNEDRMLKKTVNKALSENIWLLLHGIHQNPSFLSHMETLLWDLPSKRSSSTPRIFLSMPRSHQFPSSLYNLCLVAHIRTPLSMKEAMTRAFSLIDNDLLRHSAKPEWIPLLHNICYLHCTLNLRTRFTQAGWDLPTLTCFTNVELNAAFQMVAREFTLCDQSIVRLESAHTASGASNEANIRQLSWSSIRYGLAELIYGARTLSDYDQRAIANIVDFWIQPGSVRKDFEYSKIKYKIPAIFFTQQPKLNQLQQALESLSAHQLDVPEACHLHSTFETNLGDDILIINRLNRILDALPPNVSLNAAVQQRPNTPTEDVTINTSLSSLNGLGSSFSSAALYTFSSKKTLALEEYCATVLTSKLPRVMKKEQVLIKASHNGSPIHSPFNAWIMREAQTMIEVVHLIESHLQAIKSACDLSRLGTQWPTEIADIAHALYYQRIPDAWCDAMGPSAPPPNWGLNNFFNDLTIRAEHIEKVLTKGRDKHPAYNLSAFFNASSLFGIFKQEVANSINLSDDANYGSLSFQCELTPRDREHIREPPKDGLFIFGLYLWGCSSDKNAVEHGIADAPTRNRDACSSLPVIHLTCVSAEKAVQLAIQQQAAADTTTNSRTTALDIYSCPVFPKRSGERRSTEMICELDLWKKTSNIGQVSRWAWRGVCMTVKPY